MAKATGIHRLNALRHNWVALRLLADMLLAVAIGLLVAAVAYCFGYHLRMFGLLGLMLAEVILLILHRPWQLRNADVASFLNKHYPELEESAELMLMPLGNLTLLQKLQVAKIQSALENVPSLPKQFFKPLLRSLLILVSTCIMLAMFFKLTERWFTQVVTHATVANNQTPPEKHLPQIESVNIGITPPRYTGKKIRTQDKFTLLVEEGSVVMWYLHLNVDISRAKLIFNDKEQVKLLAVDDRNYGRAARTITKPGFYQVSIDGKLSDLYQIEIIKDSAPVIHVKTPKQYTYIDAGEAPRVTLNTVINDDYGIAAAMVFATVAKGSGEGVKFKEYKMPFGSSFGAHNSQYNLQKLFDLPKLDMEPGDQLYFYMEALDTHQQKSRTDVYTVTIQDTAQLLSMNGLLAGSNLKPEFFRSERQIILDTEKLMRERDSLTKDQFNTKSNELATDQKLLRLRYGKFLGEEDESAIEGAANDPELAKAENFNNDKMVMDAYTDKHDNAEDATFLEPAIKAQLKATLTEMWRAELQLRLYKPQAALPFAYKALRLLKDLQQKSRSYVAKTAYNPPPLKPEKRMTGDLDKIIRPDNRQEIKTPADKALALKNALATLELLKLTGKITDADRRVLQAARRNLSDKAAAEPGIYLKAVGALTRLISADKPAFNDILRVQKSIQRSLPGPKVLPQGSASAKDMGLSNSYYQNLKRTNR